jgi:deoxyribonuclease-4
MTTEEYTLGAHISVADGYQAACEKAVNIGADTFQFFTRNPRGGAAKDLDLNDIHAAEDCMQAHGIHRLLAHAPYTINMASDKEETRIGAKALLRSDLERLNSLPCRLYNVHPGSHKKQGTDRGIFYVCEAVNEALTSDIESTLLLETMSGKGTELGYSFDELRDMITGIEQKEKIGVCMDTCHLYCAGYDIVNDLDGVMDAFDRIVGMQYLKAIHLNDSVHPFGARKDHHAKIGSGTIGLEALLCFVRHPAVCNLPIILETPNELDGYRKEILLLREALA